MADDLTLSAKLHVLDQVLASLMARAAAGVRNGDKALDLYRQKTIAAVMQRDLTKHLTEDQQREWTMAVMVLTNSLFELAETERKALARR
jgi:hypothetical protein